MHVKFVGFKLYPTEQTEHWVSVKQYSQSGTLQVYFKEGPGAQPWVWISVYKGYGHESHEIPLDVQLKQFWNPQTQTPLFVALYGKAQRVQIFGFEHYKQLGSEQVVDRATQDGVPEVLVNKNPC